MMIRFHPILNDLKTKDVVIALLIIALPFLYFTYTLSPRTQIWETKLFTLNAGSFEEVLILLYILNIKLLLVFSLIAWYLTCKYWWRNAILVPLIIELFKIKSFLDPSVVNMDEIEFFHSLPLTIPIILFVFFLSNKNMIFSRYMDMSNELNLEIESVLKEINSKKSLDFKNIKNEFDILKLNKKSLSQNEYNEELYKLRNKLSEL